MEQIERTLPRTCIYCGAKPLTKEHVWSDFLRDQIGEKNERKPVTFNRVTNLWKEGGLKRPDVHKTKSGSIESRKVKIVCSDCNNGWMSVIDNQAKPFLIDLLNGSHRQLSELDQEIIASWVCKSVISNEYFYDAELCVSDDDRRIFFETNKCPKSWIVCVATYGGGHWHRSSFKYTAAIKAGVREIGSKPQLFSSSDWPSNVQQTTFGFGKVVFSAMSPDTKHFHFTEDLPNGSSGFFQIWPPRVHNIGWPKRPVDDVAVDHFAKELSRIVRLGGARFDYGLPDGPITGPEGYLFKLEPGRDLLEPKVRGKMPEKGATFAAPKFRFPYEP